MRVRVRLPEETIGLGSVNELSSDFFDASFEVVEGYHGDGAVCVFS